MDRETFNGRSSEPQPVRAAEYVRMSTDHQRYSTENQSEAIRDYARVRGIEIVRTYADSGKSGLKIEGRDALRQLIEDVQVGTTDFTMVQRSSTLAATQDTAMVATGGIDLDNQFRPRFEKPLSHNLYCVSIPFLLHKLPFVQGITSAAELGDIVAMAIVAEVDGTAGSIGTHAVDGPIKLPG